MKNFKILLSLVCLLAPALLYGQSKTYTVQGSIGHYSQPAKVYMMIMLPSGQHLDSASITDGKFVFKGTINTPQQAFIAIDTKGKGLRYISPENVTNLYLEAAIVQMTSTDSMANVHISGSQLNVDNEELKNDLKPISAKLAAVGEEYKAASPEKKKTKELAQHIDSAYVKVYTEKKALEEKFIASKPNSLVSLFALEDLSGPEPDVHEIEPIYNSLATAIRSSEEGQKFAQQIKALKNIDIGAVAPDFTQPDTLGNNVSLHDFKGKYVLVDFWASWCGPCRAENPNVLKAYNDYKDKGFTVLGISLDNPGAKDKWTAAIRHDQLTWTQVSDLKGTDNAAAELYKIHSIPQNFLVDPTGVIVGKNLRGDDLENKLASIFSK